MKQQMCMAENNEPKAVLSDAERFPLLRDLTFLNTLKQDIQAPHYNFRSGDRLEKHHLKKLKAYKEGYDAYEKIEPNKIPTWVTQYVKNSIDQVPFYKGRSYHFNEHPTCVKEEIRKQPWLFIDNHAPVNELLVYSTSGTTGPAMDVNFAPETQASWIIQLEFIMNRLGIQFSSDPQKVAIALICHQDKTLTYASLSTYLKGSGVLKINLNASEWNNIQDRIDYLEKYNPEVLTGDPLAFMALKELQPNVRPKLMVSSAMKLLPALQKELSAYFKCPVMDIYSMTECRMIAYREGNRYRSIRPDLYLEVFDKESDELLPYGEFGELVITGGNNPFLNMIRYRTGDYGCLELENGIQYIKKLEAREPVVFYSNDDKLINHIDISRAMIHIPLGGFGLHQNSDKSLQFIGWGDEKNRLAIYDVLHRIFGESYPVEIKIHPISSMKTIHKKTIYTSDLK